MNFFIGIGVGLVAGVLIGMFIMAVTIKVREYELCPRCKTPLDDKDVCTTCGYIYLGR